MIVALFELAAIVFGFMGTLSMVIALYLKSQT